MKKSTTLVPLFLSIFLLIGCDQELTSETTPKTPISNPDTVVQEPETPIVETPVTEADSNLKIYQNQKYGFEFEYPKDWETQTRVAMTELGEKDYVWFDSNFSVSVWDTSTYSFDELKAPPPGGIDPDKVVEQTITIDGNSATEISGYR
ncbi:MAG: hypothetical protein WC897_05580 [Candidatus Gracilibacteria bacterium]